VFAENIEGLSEPLESSSPIAPKRVVGPPAKPASFECIGVDVDSITLQWEQPLKDGGSPVKSYLLEMLDNGRWSKVKELSAIHTSYQVNNLSEGKQYSFRISATNDSGTCEPKQLERPVSPRKKLEPPNQPQGPLRVTDMDETSMTINWSASKSDNVTNYVIEIRDVRKAQWNQIATVKSSQLSYRLDNLTENSDYYVRVRAQNEAGLTSQALESDSFITVRSPYSIASSPRDFKVVSVGKDSVTFEFKESENNGNCEIRNYVIEKRDSKRVTWVKATKVRTSSNGVYTVEVDELTPGGTYYFRVLAENQKGLSEATELHSSVHLVKDIEPPSRPLDLQITKQKRPNSVLLSWKAPMFNGNASITEYVLEQWDSHSMDWKVVHKCSSFESHYYVNNLEDGVGYKFRIAASNSQAQSEFSMETYEFTCLDSSPPSAPTGPLKYTINDDSYTINLEWAKSKSTGGSNIKRYIIEKRQQGSTEWSKVGFTSETNFTTSEYFVEETSFSFRIIAENEQGFRSSPLETVQPVLMQHRKRVPEPVSYLRVKEKTASSLTLTWKSFSVNTYSEAERFIVEYRDKNSSEWIRAGSCLHEAFTIENLVSQRSYYIRVIGSNSAGDSSPIEILVSMEPEVPSAPVGLSIDEVTEDSVTLNWISPANSGSKPIVGYKIYRQEAHSSSEWILCGTIHRSKQLSYTVTDLDYHMGYRFRVCAYSEMGLGDAMDTSKISIKQPIVAPSEPINLFVKSVANGEISIAWMSPEVTGGSPITEYHIYRCEIREDADANDELSCRWIRHEIVDRYTLDYKFKNLNVGGKYNIRVVAHNSAGLGKSAEIRHPVIARCLYSVPDAPVGPIIFTNITRETVDASWRPPRYNGGSPLLSYFVEKRELSENIWIKVARIDAEETTLKIINVVESHKYEIRVTAENEHGKSEPLTSEIIKPLRLYGKLKFFLLFLFCFEVCEFEKKNKIKFSTIFRAPPECQPSLDAADKYQTLY